MKVNSSQDISLFHGYPFPESEGFLAGYSALVAKHRLTIPLPEKLSFISTYHRKYETDYWKIFTPRYKPDDSLADHLTFALRYEGIDLSILSSLFEIINPIEIEEWVKREPSGQYSRRIWFLYEWLTKKELELPLVKSGNFVDIVDTKQQYPGSIKYVKRQRVRNNLPGVLNFCPLIRRTSKLETFIKQGLKYKAQETIKEIHPDVISRAAAFLMLQDSRASFTIEGETPSHSRAERWGKVLMQAGLFPLTMEELLRLQQIVIEDKRFVTLGLRKQGGFIGTHDRLTGMPLPDHISAKWQDLEQIMKGFFETYKTLKSSNLDPVLQAAILSFGFVFIHPFEDGNGRLHRYLMHHILAEQGFSPPQLIFPVSAVILERLNDYKLILELYSKPRLDLIEWKPTEKGNVEVINNTLSLYSYFDATRQAEFLYECVFETIHNLLPKEIKYLERYDQMKNFIINHFEMPNHLIDLLVRFLQQNKGRLSKRAKETEFKMLTEKECLFIENKFSSIFEV